MSSDAQPFLAADQEDRIVAAILAAGIVAANGGTVVLSDDTCRSSAPEMNEAGAKQAAIVFLALLPYVRRIRRAERKHYGPDSDGGG